MGRLRLAIVILAVLASVASGRDDKDEPKFDVDMTPGWGNCYRPMEWTPIDVVITTNLKVAFEGRVMVRAQQDELTRMRVLHKITLTPDMPFRVPIVTKLAKNAPDYHVEIQDARGRARWKKKYSLWGRNTTGVTPVAISDESILIGVTGRPGFGLMSLHKGARAASKNNRGKVYVKSRRVRMLPWDWTGYASLDVLVMYNVAWEKLHPTQSQAITEWVSNGGSLLIVPGGRPLGRDHPLAKLLPFAIKPIRQVSVPQRAVRKWGSGLVAGGGDSELPFWTIPLAIGGRWRVDTVEAGDGRDVPLYAEGPVGFGRVGVLACDPSSLTGRYGANVARFWIARLTPLMPSRRMELGTRVDQGRDWREHQLGQANAATNVVLEHLLDIRELKPLSIWVVIVLLAGLAVVIGPVDYLVLKRIGRLPLTWVTSATCVALFTIGAYWGVQRLRGGVVQVRAVSVMDGIKPAPPAGGGLGVKPRGVWCTTYSGIFAPTSSDYRLDELGERQWWSSVVPTTDRYNIYSARDTATREITCEQGPGQEGANLPSSVPINIWSMQNLITEEPLADMPFDVRVKRNGKDVEVTIINKAEAPVVGGSIRIGKDLEMRLGPVPAEDRRKFSGQLVAASPWADAKVQSDGWGNYPQAAMKTSVESAFFGWGTRKRTLAMKDYLQHGAAVVSLRYENVSPGFDLAGRKQNLHHIRMARLVVLPGEDTQR